VIGTTETLIEIKKYEAITMESIIKLGLNNHPISNYFKDLFSRRK
jgi:hypothetical protein